ncbi:MAG: TetR/AcrR family transcriptional regulator [Alphaproteobacteria bacterium]|nr:TetR/AcrR family transcriptional regulator [Alphaproteobacteria bacterium]
MFKAPSKKADSTGKDAGKSATKPRKRGRPARSSQEPSAPDTILKAALEEFALNGFDGTNLSDIAARAGVAKPLLHYHFQSKDELWRATMRASLKARFNEFENAYLEVKGLDPVSALRLLLRKYALFCLRNPHVARIIVFESSRQTERGEWLRENYIQPSYALAERLTKPIFASGRIRKVKLGHLLPMLNGAMHAFVADLRHLKDRYGLDLESRKGLQEAVDETVDIFIDGLVLPERDTGHRS